MENSLSSKKDSATSKNPNQKFSKSDRLSKSFEFDNVFQKNTIRLSNEHILLLANQSADERARIGLVVPKKKIRSAVRRNLFKRVARESFRRKKYGLEKLDIIILAKKDIYKLSPARRSVVFNSLLEKLDINPG